MKLSRLNNSLLWGLALLLTACANPTSPTPNSPYYGAMPIDSIRTAETAITSPVPEEIIPYRLAAEHWGDVAKLRSEADRLGLEVQQGRMTKTQAAQHLNLYRLQLVGHNMVDDSVYEVYLRSAVQSQSGQISPEQSKTFIQNTLKGWQSRWEHIPAADRPQNPAFTNFLMEVMEMQPLN